jgi:hypothetical protein
MATKTVAEITQEYFDSIEKLYKGKSVAVALKDAENFIYSSNTTAYDKKKISAICIGLASLIKDDLEKIKDPSESEKIIMKLYSKLATGLGVKNVNPK